MCKLIFLLLVLTILKGSCKVQFSTGMKTFSHAIKGAYCNPNVEIEVFRYSKGPGVVTEQWFTGGECLGPNTIVRYYIDGDLKPTIEMNLYLGHGIGFVSAKENPSNTTYPEMVGTGEPVVGEDMGIPWGNRRIGHTAKGGGIYNTIRMPFQKSIRITFETPQHGYYWFIVRGAQNYPIVIGDLVLPRTAMLKLYKRENVVLQPAEYIQLASTANSSGLLYQVTLAASSNDFNYLEACFRVLIDEEKNFQFLSSGTEDFFLSAFYYSAGIFHTDHAGLTYFKSPGTMSAYKFFEDDPVAFSKSFKLIWRCGELKDNACYKQDSDKVFVQRLSLQPTTMSAYVWMYEW